MERKNSIRPTHRNVILNTEHLLLIQARWHPTHLCSFSEGGLSLGMASGDNN